MRNRLILGTLLVASLGLPALAQNAPPNPSPSNSSPNISAANFDALKQHLSAGATIYDMSGKPVGTLATIDGPTDGFLIFESSNGAAGGVNVTRRLPAGSVSWSNNHLVTSVSASEISKLPSQ